MKGREEGRRDESVRALWLVANDDGAVRGARRLMREWSDFVTSLRSSESAALLPRISSLSCCSRLPSSGGRLTLRRAAMSTVERATAYR